VVRGPGPSAAQAALRGLCGGAVHLPGDPGYDLARTPWNTAVDQRPAAVAYPADPAEVAAVVRAARATGLRVAPQGTGHHAGALGPLDDVVLLRTAAMIGLSVNRGSRRARAGAGMLWADVVDRLAPLAAPHPATPDVGVVGFSLAGGLSWYGRALGLQSTGVSAVELVTAGGEVARVDADHDADLFWALRGGGANFGVVTAIEFAVHDVPTAYAGLLAWDWTRAGDVLHRWAAWAADAPDDVTTTFRILRDRPGRDVVVITGATMGAGSVLAPLRALRPQVDTFATVPTASLARLHADPEGPRPGGRESLLFDRLGAGALDAFLATAGPGSGSAMRSAELRQLGGALGRPHPRGGAVSHVDGRYLLVAAPDPAPDDPPERGVEDARRLVDALAPWANGRRYLGLAGGSGDVSAGYPPDAWERLRAVRATVDPDGLLVAAHPVPPAR
jgi:FAD/FMN-containing dehydrogenase